MKLERRNEGTTDRDQARHDQSTGRLYQRSSRPPSSEEMHLDSRDNDPDDQFRGKSDGEMLARYEF